MSAMHEVAEQVTDLISGLKGKVGPGRFEVLSQHMSALCSACEEQAAYDLPPNTPERSERLRCAAAHALAARDPARATRLAAAGIYAGMPAEAEFPLTSIIRVADLLTLYAL